MAKKSSGIQPPKSSRNRSTTLQAYRNATPQQKRAALAQGQALIAKYAAELKEEIANNMRNSGAPYPAESYGITSSIGGAATGAGILTGTVTVPGVPSPKPKLELISIYGMEDYVHDEGWAVTSIYEDGWHIEKKVPWRDIPNVGFREGTNAIHNAVAKVAAKAAADGVTITLDMKT